MKENNLTTLKRELEQMSSRQLEEMLHAETEKATPDDDTVLLILSILEDRGKDDPIELGEKSSAAWETYQAKAEARARKTAINWNPLIRAAVLTVTIGCLLLTVVPKQAQAETFWEKLARWTAEIVEFFGSDDNEGRLLGYEFKTDNPGLQQVYDKAVELGVTIPVVPMWLLDGSELVELKVEYFPSKTRVHSRFLHSDSEVVFYIDIYNTEVLHQYQKDETEADIHESGGVAHEIFKNYDRMVVVWSNDNVECSIFIECQEDTLCRILDSIYEMEDE